MNNIAYCVILTLFKNRNPSHLVKKLRKKKKKVNGPKMDLNPPQTKIFLKSHKYKLFKLYDPFLWMGFDCLKGTQPLQGDSLLFTTRCQGGPWTHLIDLGRMKG